MSSDWLQISPLDNVAVALKPLASGDAVSGVTLKADIPMGHKLALTAIRAGEPVIKYGYPIGSASIEISAGDHVHTSNTRTLLSERAAYTYSPVVPEAAATGLENASFRGYPRPDGRVGTRNEIWIINTVGCVNRCAERLAAQASQRFKGRTDGIFTFVHPHGCSQLGQDHEATRAILLNLARHPNAGGVLVLGLGCENNTLPAFRNALGAFDPARIRFLAAQDVEDELETGMALIEALVQAAEKDLRVESPVSALVVGMKCGGSDGLSGITANPLTGRFSDRLISAGGTVILTEVPEMFGAETILMNRCRNRAIFNQTVALINNFKEYLVQHGQVVYENPSPGNKAGGLTTLEDKSLGCIQKGGRATVEEVLPYAGMVTQKGLILLDAPGNDIVSTTALAAAGATLILFTTGRGTPLGAPVPTIKIASNTQLAKHKKNWIDFNAGVIAEGTGIDELCSLFSAEVLKTASGRKVCNERNNYREIAIFKNGVTL